MHESLNVKIKNNDDKSYVIDITDSPIEDLISALNKITTDKKRLFVVSEKVYKLYKKHLNLTEEHVYILKDGENQKNLKNYEKILKFALKLSFTRKDYIIALGGGVVGDIAGCVAATYMRGINYIQVPTTLLAMVDSSVGGKTAVNISGYKNIAGAFYQPQRVLINLNFLKTLDCRQYLSGVGEILKYAMIEDKCGSEEPLYLFEYLALSPDKLLNKDSITLSRVIEYCLKLKVAVVEKDEKESGLRKILNFGHTFSHALEEITRFKKFTHGEAVVAGMYFIFNYAFKKNIINCSEYSMTTGLLDRYGFSYLKNSVSKYNNFKMTSLIMKDKKSQSDKVTLIFPFGKKTVREVQYTSDEILGMFS